jgi:hypothetical protein
VVVVGTLNLILAPEFGSGQDSGVIYRGSVILALDCAALTWVGMWHGVTANRFSRAVLTTMARVMIPPWIILFVFFADAASSAASSSTVRAFFMFWFLLVVVYDVWLVARFRSRLKRHFRAAAARVPRMKSGKLTPAEFVRLAELSSTPRPG